MPKHDLIKEVLSDEKELSLMPQENRLPDIADEYSDMISSYSEELLRLEQEKELVVRLPILKQKFVTLFCSGQYKHREIARILGVHPGTISSWLKNEEVKSAVEAFQAEENIVIDSTLKAIRMRAVNKLADLLEAGNEIVQIQATKEILDRTGHSAVEKKEVNINLTYEERLKKLIVEDVDFTVIND